MLSGTPRTFIGATTFVVADLDARSARALRAQLSRLDGITTVTVDPPSGTVTVRASRPVDRADVAAALGDAGFRVAP